MKGANKTEMSKIIQISKLYDNYNEMIFGYVGIDIESKKIRYYSYYNSNNEYTPNTLYEYNPTELNTDSIINWHMYHCDYKRPEISQELPKNLTNLIHSYINKHMIYNLNHNYTIENINNNKKNLSIQYEHTFSLLSDPSFSACYVPVENIILLTTDETEWKELSPKEKKDFKNILIHEIGHMKASYWTVDDINNVLYVKTGFYHTQSELEPIVMETGDIFYKMITTPNKWEHQVERALEEIINDLDCSYAFPKFYGVYPQFGEKLNELCDRKLTYARYNNGLEQLFIHLQSIINSKDLAIELLENIKDSIYGFYNRE